MTRDDIRRLASCPLCGADIGVPCIYSGKGSEKAMRIGKNHAERMQVAQGSRAEGEIDVIDWNDT